METNQKERKHSSYKSRKCKKRNQGKNKKIWENEGTASILMSNYKEESAGKEIKVKAGNYEQKEGMISIFMKS